jgi:hypothetical protein
MLADFADSDEVVIVVAREQASLRQSPDVKKSCVRSLAKERYTQIG